MAEWSNAPDSKSGSRSYRDVGSNPTLSTKTASKAIFIALIHAVPLDDDGVGTRDVRTLSNLTSQPSAGTHVRQADAANFVPNATITPPAIRSSQVL